MDKLTGGTLVRSAGGWSEVKAQKRQGQDHVMSDEPMLFLGCQRVGHVPQRTGRAVGNEFPRRGVLRGKGREDCTGGWIPLD